MENENNVNWTLPNLLPEEKISRESQEIRQETEKLRPVKSVKQVKPIKSTGNQWLKIQALHEDVYKKKSFGIFSSKEKKTEKVISQTNKALPRVEVKSEASLPIAESKPAVVVPEVATVEKFVKKTKGQEGANYFKTGINLILSLAVVMAGMFILVAASDSVRHRTSRVPLRQPIEEKQEIVSPLKSTVVVNVSTVPEMVPYETYVRQSKDSPVIKQSLAARAVEDSRAKKLRQELGALAGADPYGGEAETKADAITQKAKAQVKKLLSKHYRNEKEKRKAKIKADKILAMAEKNANAILSDAAKKSKRISDLMAEQAIGVKREKLAQMPKPTVENKNVVYIESDVEYKLLVNRRTNDGSLVPDIDIPRNGILPYRFESNEVCLQLVKVEDENNTVINDQCQKFSGAVSYWVYDGKKLEKREEPPTRTREALINQEKLKQAKLLARR